MSLSEVAKPYADGEETPEGMLGDSLIVFTDDSQSPPRVIGPKKTPPPPRRRRTPRSWLSQDPDTTIAIGLIPTETPAADSSVHQPCARQHPLLSETSVSANSPDRRTSSLPDSSATITFSKLDANAPSYIPSCLTAVDDSPAFSGLYPGIQSMDYGHYIRSFAGSDYLQPTIAPRLPELLATPPVYSASLDSLSPETYGACFWEALQHELSAEAAQLQESNILAAPLEALYPTGQFFRLQVPGLRCDTPRIEIGDVILVRPRLDVDERTDHWSALGGGKNTGHLAPGFCGLEFHATVWCISNVNGEIVLRVDGLLQPVCNIIFPLQTHRIAPLARSIQLTADSLRTSEPKPLVSPWLKRMLFPVPSDCVTEQSMTVKSFVSPSSITTQLDDRQRAAIDAVLSSKYGLLPYLIFEHAVPDKTKMLIEIALQLLRRSQRSNSDGLHHHNSPHILLCASSDLSADALAYRLSWYLTTADLFRLNRRSRPVLEIPPYLLPHSYVVDGTFAMPKFSSLMTYRVVVTTCRDADMLIQAQLTNHALGLLARATLQAVAPAASSALSGSQMLHWTALLIDDAPQITEPEVLIPLTVVAPSIDAQTECDHWSSLPQLVLAGSKDQPGPRLFAKTTSILSVSLFARLSYRAPYVQHPSSLQNGWSRPTSPTLVEILPSSSSSVYDNRSSNRSSPPIISIPAQLLYHGTTSPKCGPVSPAVGNWPGWNAPHRWPLLFVANSAAESAGTLCFGENSTSDVLFNEGEALRATEIVSWLLDCSVQGDEPSQKLQQDEIAVTSPFTAQVAFLKRAFCERGLQRVNIRLAKALGSFQSRVLLYCTTRRRRPVRENHMSRPTGSDAEKAVDDNGGLQGLNLAITSAKEGLIVLGDGETLTVGSDPCWRAFLNFCARYDCITFEDKEGAADMAWVKRLDGKHELQARDPKEKAARTDTKEVGNLESRQARDLPLRILPEAQLPSATGGAVIEAAPRMTDRIELPTVRKHIDHRLQPENSLLLEFDDDAQPDPWNAGRDPPRRDQDPHVIQDILTGSPIKAHMGSEVSTIRSPALSTAPQYRTDKQYGDFAVEDTDSEGLDRGPEHGHQSLDCATQ